MNGEAANPVNQRLAPHMSRNDALKGATLAFQQSRDSSPNVNSRLSAAAAAAMTRDRQLGRQLSRQRTGSDVGPEVGSVKDKIGRLTPRPLSPSNTLNPRGRSSADALSSTSELAARLAASRSPARNAIVPPTVARLGAVRSASRLPPSLEKRQLLSPTPVPSNQEMDIPMDDMQESDLESDSEPLSYAISPPQRSRPTIEYHGRESSPHPSLESQHSMPLDVPKPRLPPRVPPPRGSNISSLLRASTPSTLSLSSQSNSTSNASLIDDPIGMGEEALSDAIVASSLASVRASPSLKVPPPLPPQRRRARSFLHLGNSPKDDLSRTPSPPRSMPQTLRGTPKHADADYRKQRHRHRNPLHKHPHKHNEGNRKRWRQVVTEKERKRYEGVWASNKGLLIPTGIKNERTEEWPPNTSEMVLNLVVRDIWSRSRLPETVLEQVWDLVDHQHIGLLMREEFVVGMWLIDQYLKGRKLPVKVPDSVWDSVRYIAGIKLPLTEKGKAHA